jgi:hypothetical protein
MAGQPGLFDLDERYAALSRTGDPLERLAAVVDFEIFRADLDAALARSDRSKGGRPPMDAVILVELRLAPREVLEADELQTLEATFRRRGGPVQHEVLRRLGSRMEAGLLAEDVMFRVEALSSATQEVDFESAVPLRWDWRVTLPDRAFDNPTASVVAARCARHRLRLRHRALRAHRRGAHTLGSDRDASVLARPLAMGAHRRRRARSCRHTLSWIVGLVRGG